MTREEIDDWYLEVLGLVDNQDYYQVCIIDGKLSLQDNKITRSNVLSLLRGTFSEGKDYSDLCLNDGERPAFMSQTHFEQWGSAPKSMNYKTTKCKVGIKHRFRCYGTCGNFSCLDKEEEEYEASCTK